MLGLVPIVEHEKHVHKTQQQQELTVHKSDKYSKLVLSPRKEA